MKKLIPAYLRIIIIFFAVFGTMEYFIDSGNQPAFVKFPMVSLFLFVFLFLLIAIEITVNAVDTITYQLLTEEQKAKLEETSAVSYKESAWFKKLIKALTKSEPIENEGQLLLDHDYDGIKELDNSLPPWWVYLFYGCIIFAVVYLVRFEVMGGDNQEMELKKEMAQAQIDIANYKKTAPDLMDEKTVTLLTSPADLATGKKIFMTNCVACHRPDAGGLIGPNLTDDRWILGGGIKNVFHTITNGGRDGKGMIAWSKSGMKPKDIQLVASYVLSLQGSNPVNPKAPEGEVWTDSGSPKKVDAVVETKTETTETATKTDVTVSENNVVLLTSPADLAAGKKIFMTTCVACHRPDAGGLIGPNLTDNRWILGGGIKNVVNTITNGGREGKGMVAWSKSGMKPKDIQLVASYVLSLQGTNPPNPKAPEGDVWVGSVKK